MLRGTLSSSRSQISVSGKAAITENRQWEATDITRLEVVGKANPVVGLIIFSIS